MHSCTIDVCIPLIYLHGCIGRRQIDDEDTETLEKEIEKAAEVG